MSMPYRCNKLLEGCTKGNHMILCYNSQKEKHQTIFPFIEDGLEQEEAIIYLSDEQSVKQITKDISAFGIDVDKHEKTGALKVLNCEGGMLKTGLSIKKWQSRSG